MTTILITGVSGFIGADLAKSAHEKGFSIRGAVKTNPETIPSFVEHNFVENITGNTDWALALDNVDVVIHLAAIVHVIQEKEKNSLIEFRRINTEATMNLARQAAKKGVKRFIYLSTIKVNGESTLPGIPFTEDDEYIPVDPYALSKYEAEQGLLRLAKKTQMEVVIIRPPLVYGPGVKANFLYMMKWLYKEIPLPFGAINNLRSLIGLQNLLSFIIVCVDHKDAANQIFLVSDDEDLSTTELLMRVTRALGKKNRMISVNQKLLEWSFKLLGKNHLSQRLCGSLQVDISKAKNKLNWKPPLSVDIELSEVAKIFLESNI